MSCSPYVTCLYENGCPARGGSPKQAMVFVSLCFRSCFYPSCLRNLGSPPLPEFKLQGTGNKGTEKGVNRKEISLRPFGKLRASPFDPSTGSGHRKPPSTISTSSTSSTFPSQPPRPGTYRNKLCRVAASCSHLKLNTQNLKPNSGSKIRLWRIVNPPPEDRRSASGGL